MANGGIKQATLERLPGPLFRKLAAFVLILGVVIFALSFVFEAFGDENLASHTREAVITLIVASIVGGVVKVLVDDIGLVRSERAENARFVQAVLDDLKSVYDRVERARLLIEAHRSAKTFGDEVRDLIDSRVTLTNVKRALDNIVGFTSARTVDIRKQVETMEEFLGSAISEFHRAYLPIASQQRSYESAMDAWTKDPVGEAPTNAAWPTIQALNMYKNLIRPANDEGEPAEYSRQFIGPLDDATRLLRAELAAIFSADRTNRPPDTPAALPANGTR